MIIKSENDQRKYKYIQLENKLDVVIISDKELEKSSASLDVKVGNFHDPSDILGLAHFLEHMLFLGTKKYPKESSYSEYILMHSGSKNASTSKVDTRYFFEVTNNAFEEALDRISQFFISPLFDENSVEREIKAVDSENAKNYNVDSRRFFHLQRTLSRKDHVYSKFSTGNLKTLSTIPKEKGIDVRKRVIDFYEKHYSANVMKLAIIGNQDIEVMEKWVVEKFSPIVNKDVNPITWTDLPYSEKELQSIVYVVPVKDIRELKLSFQLPSMDSYLKEKPDSILSHLLGHESEGSILRHLREKGLATSLSSGCSTTPFFSLFNVTVGLTEQGLKEKEKVISLVFNYIDMLKHEGVPQRIFDEIQTINNCKFRYKEKENSANYVQDISIRMQVCPIEDVLVNPYNYKVFDPKLIHHILTNYLTHESVIIYVTSKDNVGQTDLVEEWYDIHYKREKIPRDLLNLIENPPVKWDLLDPPLHLPSENPFLPKNFEIKKVSSKVEIPKLIREEKFCKVWHKQDFTFNQPKANISINFFSPPSYSSAPNAIMSSLVVDLLLEQLLKKNCYFALLAGLSFKIDNNTNGFDINVSGFNDKLEELVYYIIEEFKNLKFTEKQFQIYKEKKTRSYKNYLLSQPYEHSTYHSTLLLLTPKFSMYDYVNAVGDISYQQLVDHSKLLFQNLSYDSLIMGNLTAEDSLRISKGIDKLIFHNENYSPLLANIKVVQLQAPYSLYKVVSTNKNEKNCSVNTYFQIGDERGDKTRSILALFAQIVKSDCFAQLRTREQLGYLVWSSPSVTMTVLGYKITVQSSVATPQYLDSRIELWLESLETLLSNLEESKFQQYKNSLIISKQEPFKGLNEEKAAYTDEFFFQQYVFDRRFKVAEELKSITKEDVLSFYRKYIKKGSLHRHKLSSWVFASVAHDKVLTLENFDESGIQFIPDLKEFKSSQKFFSNY
eukprot:TRINITY_DN2818_c1_g1_i2.p1 TRINITY_DN2818_c1_g1~~TRINITY_DN2818_c1_g1_i2.p1  ORF type:complete len:950 (+),score=301.19 TRINITY_DN2818_c1_g1_i2:340-3189(+)